MSVVINILRNATDVAKQLLELGLSEKVNYSAAKSVLKIVRPVVEFCPQQETKLSCSLPHYLLYLH